jgi:c-di-GMP-binding flagellar brake protein YcgR
VVEKRRNQRFRLDVLQVNGTLSFATEVTLFNIGMGGVSLKADQRLNVGGKYVIKLEVGGKLLPLKGVVVWSRLSESRSGNGGEVVPLYTAGMKFVDLSEEKGAGLLSFIERHGREEIPAGERRHHVRFKIKAGESILSFPVDYDVRTISVGGMLIESEYAMEIEGTLPIELSLQNNRSVNFPGRVVFCRVTELGRHESGIEFLDLSDEHREVVAAFCNYLASLENAKI